MLRPLLIKHDAVTTAYRMWDGKSNGALISAATRLFRVGRLGH
jgi:hypothetical protein